MVSLASTCGEYPTDLNLTTRLSPSPVEATLALGGVHYQRHPSSSRAPLFLSVPLPVLGSAASATLTFDSTGPLLHQGREGALHYCADEHQLWCTATLPAIITADPQSFADQISALYSDAHRLMVRLGYPYFWRQWNYLQDINGDHQGLERYRRFNIGRQDSFKKNGIPPTAASTLGLETGGYLLAFLSGRQPAQTFENPRQTHPKSYPQQYGPKAPQFTRAAVAQGGPWRWLFISGTASILGHESQHLDDCTAQTLLTMENIDALLAHINANTGQQPFARQQLHLTAYLRHAHDYPLARGLIEKHWPAQAEPVIYLQSDICRQELLVEIEAYSRQSTP